MCMWRTEWLKILAALVLLNSIGCKSHQVRIDELQKEYDRLGSQFQRDCNEELLKVPPTLSPKCQDENKQVQDAWNRLQAERNKK
jgi:hypothetical protein